MRPTLRAQVLVALCGLSVGCSGGLDTRFDANKALFQTINDAETVAVYTFDVLRPSYYEWLDVTRGVTDPKVKRWRHLARLFFQGTGPFNRERWWAAWEAGGAESGWQA